MMLSKDHAQQLMVKYIVSLEYARDKVRKNFEDMDLENVKIRDLMEREVENIERDVNRVIKSLYAMMFE
ncbi:MAG: hypothetical protein NC124_05080 [Clostridium sp.]|nr:hypothetical protein [Clostridium sp.]